MIEGFSQGAAIFPQPKRLKTELKKVLDESIYLGSTLALETEGMRKRVVLVPPGDRRAALPFNVWSAGQREFTPLLLGLYWLMPPGKVSRTKAVDTVIIEEPEMGLHPQAIVGFGLLVLELIHRGYRVVLSTHSPVILDLAWALGELKGASRTKALAALREIFGVPSSPQMQAVLVSALQKTCRAYFFERKAGGVVVKDISSLDPGSDDLVVAGWGGLSGFSGKIAELVGAAVAGGGT